MIVLNELSDDELRAYGRFLFKCYERAEDDSDEKTGFAQRINDVMSEVTKRDMLALELSEDDDS
jgi:hypothetical protein